MNEYDELHASGIAIPGRLTLNLWRLLRGELKLGIYTQVRHICTPDVSFVHGDDTVLQCII